MMTITIDEHIEELRAEIQGCTIAEERRQIAVELAEALIERDRRRDAEPPR
jgi:hypothetical protein